MYTMYTCIFWNIHFYFDKSKNGRTSHQNLFWTEICNQWISRYIVCIYIWYIYIYIYVCVWIIVQCHMVFFSQFFGDLFGGQSLFWTAPLRITIWICWVPGIMLSKTLMESWAVNFQRIRRGGDAMRWLCRCMMMCVTIGYAVYGIHCITPKFVAPHVFRKFQTSKIVTLPAPLCRLNACAYPIRRWRKFICKTTFGRLL